MISLKDISIMVCLQIITLRQWSHQRQNVRIAEARHLENYVKAEISFRLWVILWGFPLRQAIHRSAGLKYHQDIVHWIWHSLSPKHRIYQRYLEYIAENRVILGLAVCKFVLIGWTISHHLCIHTYRKANTLHHYLEKYVHDSLPLFNSAKCK